MLDEKGLAEVFAPYAAKHEGYVVRTADEFRLADFQTRLVKMVREGHVQTDQHWAHQQMQANGLAADA